jgi:hypothetical protein
MLKWTSNCGGKFWEATWVNQSATGIDPVLYVCKAAEGTSLITDH